MTRDQVCECSDPGCPVGHPTHNLLICGSRAGVTILYRIDMQDESGTAFCESCAADALDAGVFTTRDDDDDDTVQS